MLVISTAITAGGLSLNILTQDNVTLDLDVIEEMSFVLSGIPGMMLLLLSIPVGFVSFYSLPHFGIVLLAWSLIPFIIYLTKNIPAMRRIFYVYFFITHMAVILSVWFFMLPM